MRISSLVPLFADSLNIIWPHTHTHKHTDTFTDNVGKPANQMDNSCTENLQKVD